MIEAVLQVKPPQTWIRGITAKFPAKIRVFDCKALEGKEGVQELFEIVSDKESVERILKELKHDAYISELDIISAKEGRITGSVKTLRCTACRTLATSNCFLVSVSSSQEGSVEWTVLASENGYKQLLGGLEQQGVGVAVKKLSRAKGGESLTARQEEILRIALEKGYFDYPKGIGLRPLAELLDISAPTLSELLRKAQKKVLLERFKGKVSALSRQHRV